MAIHPGRWALAILGVAGCGVAAVWSVRAGWADFCSRQETVASTERAVAAMPGEALYGFRLAMLLADQDPKRSYSALQRALALNPADAESWIELGLRSEAKGDYATAERSLLRAAEENKLYLPRWTLANYYYRRNDAARFWHWSRSAVCMVYGDPAPLFELCERLADGADLGRLLDLRSPKLRANYLSYLLGRRDAGRMASAAQRVLASGRPSDTSLLLGACDRLLDGKRIDEASELWNSLIAARRIPLEIARPQGGSLVNNGDFAISPTSRCFDWQLVSTEGVSAAREQAPRGLRLTFSGNQPERCEPLYQFVPVQEDSTYDLSFTYRTSGIAPDAGPHWAIVDNFGGRVIAASPGLSSQDDAEGRLSLVIPAGCRLIRLALAYQRAVGTTRIEGNLILRQVQLRQLPRSAPVMK